MVTLRMIMQGKEAGSIIGKKGDNVKKFREDSGAKINISDSSCPERIVTVTGTTDQIFKAFTMICKKFEEDIVNTHNSTTLPKPPVTLRLIVPASQCGSLIGKGGAKIKEIRELTGASIQVASEMLPNSTERAVTVSGQADAITQCIYNICCVMLESPPKGATIPYRPKPCVPPVMLPSSCGGQAFSIQGQQILLPPSHPNATQPDVSPHCVPLPPPCFISLRARLQTHSLICIIIRDVYPGMNAAMAAGIPQFAPRQAGPGANMSAQTHEMTIPNDLIGCIIGRGGAKINEIRQLSGATIKIANADEGSSDRKVTIMGSLETIHAAQYMINAR
ncbi:hypothetical protein CAPTEDRAFT_1308 [Capitella teleta]|uniref:K Homology domain-containing protein n=1 Tax=Capitella teleta TaxID=283909 RepID=R7TGX4_CAPTE|nr:hypothetical protein CAPTEDRAFT_1308 [Capitella teleta]|eukprot:ELT90806.1 hypothetical protein CAPTEDRAFT_1308 [Capitella teleta]